MKISVKKLTIMAMLTAIALIIFIIEAQIPLPVPVPGAKLGLANVVTLFALFYKPQPPGGSRGKEKKTPGKEEQTPGNLTTANAFTILLCRIILGAAFTGRMLALIYSLTGGLLGFTAQVIVKRFVTHKQIWVCGAIGAVFHNVGQIIAAILVTGTPSIVAYMPVLIIAGVITGALTGLIAQLTLARISKDILK